MTQWQNRIVGYGTEAPDQLLANPHNHRIHPKRQQDALSGSLDTLGYIQTVIVNRNTGHIVDGHLRVTMALREGQGEIPVTYVELSEAEEAQALLSLDPIAAMAASDASKVDELLRMVNTDNEKVMQHLTDLAAENKLDWGQAKQGDAEPQIDRAAELLEKWQVKTGDLWQIGEHRLICGDCTDAAVVARVMGGEKATLMFTDPPYSFETDGGWFNGKRPKVMDVIKEAGINIFDPLPFLGTLSEIFNKGYHSSFIFCNKALVHQYLNYAVENDFSYNILVWKKSNVVPFGDSHFPDIEYLIFIRKGAKWNNGTNANRSKVLVYDQDFETQKDHPTPKPLQLVENELVLTTDEKDIVYDAFIGSGTTLVACQNLSRRGRAIEISPAYCAVTLERMSQAFPHLEIRRIE